MSTDSTNSRLNEEPTCSRTEYLEAELKRLQKDNDEQAEDNALQRKVNTMLGESSLRHGKLKDDKIKQLEESNMELEKRNTMLVTTTMDQENRIKELEKAKMELEKTNKDQAEEIKQLRMKLHKKAESENSFTKVKDDEDKQHANTGDSDSTKLIVPRNRNSTSTEIPVADKTVSPPIIFISDDELEKAAGSETKSTPSCSIPRTNSLKKERMRSNEENYSGNEGGEMDSVKKTRKISKINRSTPKLRRRRVSSDSEEDGRHRKRKVHSNKETYQMESSMWDLIQKLNYAYQKLSTEKTEYTEEQFEKVKKIIENYKEQYPQHYMEAAISLDSVFSDNGDYRHCRQYLIGTTVKYCEWTMDKKRGRPGNPPTKPPQLSLIGPIHVELDCSADEVVDAAKKWKESNQNAVFTKINVEAPIPDENLLQLEQNQFMAQLNGLSGSDRYRRPVPTLIVKTKEEVEDPRFEKLLNSASITKVSGIGKALGIESELFEFSRIASDGSSLEVETLYQISQREDINFNMKGVKCWRTTGIKIPTKLSELSEYMESEKSKALIAFDKVAKSKQTKNALEKLQKKFIEDQDLPAFEELDRTFHWHKFGTNIDLNGEKFKVQVKELEKFPKFLRTKNQNNMLSYASSNILGVNTVQLYGKACGARTAAHMENSLVASINWNCGPGTCVWFAVPYEYWGKVERMVTDNEAKYHNQEYWPNEKELLDAGIPVIKFEQKADEMVYVNTGCFHWVQSSGFCVNVSWNVAQPTFTQLATSMIAHDHNLLSKNPAHIPLVNIVWNAARDKKFMEDELMYKAMRSVMIRSLAYVKMYMDSEKSINKYVNASNEDFDPIEYCRSCGAEVFNIVKWYWNDDESVRSFPFCAQCTPSKADQENRTLKFTRFFSLDSLKQVFDDYTRKP